MILSFFFPVFQLQASNLDFYQDVYYDSDLDSYIKDEV
jgi:hypothetical protein